MQEQIWRKCSQCKNPIHCGGSYYECSVSTCTSARTGYVFCSMDCWEQHLPGARHRDAAAFEKTAPNTPATNIPAESGAANAPTPTGARKIIIPSPQTRTSPAEEDVLVVVSKVKNYIRQRSDMNTAQAVMDILSDRVRRLCDEAIDSARADERKTVLERDFK